MAELPELGHGENTNRFFKQKKIIMIKDPSDNKQVEVISTLKSLIDEVLPNVPEDDMMSRPFLEMGANSLVLMELQKTVEEKWGLELRLPMFFEELTNIESLVSYIEKNAVTKRADDKINVNKNKKELSYKNQNPPNLKLETHRNQVNEIIGGAIPSELQKLLDIQLAGASKIISDLANKQLEFLKSHFNYEILEKNNKESNGNLRLNQNSNPDFQLGVTSETDQTKASSKSQNVRPQMMLNPLEIRSRGLSNTQQVHLESLIERFTKRTAKSKKLADETRPVLADSRASVGFRFTTKEMLYPIVGDKAAGSRLWDIDGNEYIDITMGQGVSLFGHHPKFIENSLGNRARDCMELGPRPPEAGMAASLIAKMTGMDRVTFTNSGTEAVMAAIRLARAATGREKIIMFQGSYHGHADNVMGIPNPSAGYLATKPASAGIPQGAINDLVVLDYDDEKSLEIIREMSSTIAAVLVEPVQSRKPELQPKLFLKELRTLTREIGSLLIFDEMITGFRIHQGGAQKWFDVEADLVTYGKVVGGGLPIGVVAGRGGLMDPIDGGPWRYGDSSYPSTERVIFGGTFCQHPLVMASTLATLKHLDSQGPQLQEKLNIKTEHLKSTLNKFFIDEEMPIQVVNFGSLFRFSFNENLELLFYHLMEKGIFIWEWRNYFLSTAHSIEDVDMIISAVKESALELRKGDFLKRSKIKSDSVQKGGLVDAIPVKMTKAQSELYALSVINKSGAKAYQVAGNVELIGNLDFKRLEKCFDDTVRSHISLNLKVSAGGDSFDKYETNIKLKVVDLSVNNPETSNIDDWLNQPIGLEFDLNNGPLMHAFLVKIDQNRAILRLVGHHIVMDGISMNILLREILTRYDNKKINSRIESQFTHYLATVDDKDYSSEKDFWRKKLSRSIVPVELPTDRQLPTNSTFKSEVFTHHYSNDQVNKIKKQAIDHGCTEFMYVFSLFGMWLQKITRSKELIIGVPVAGRPTKDSLDVVGYCTHLVPVIIPECGKSTLQESITDIRTQLLSSYENQQLPYSELRSLLNIRSNSVEKDPLISVVFNFDEPGDLEQMEDIKVGWLPISSGYTAYDLTCNFTVNDGKYFLELVFQSDTVSHDLAYSLGEGLVSFIEKSLCSSEKRVSSLPAATDAELTEQLHQFNCGENTKSHGSILEEILKRSQSVPNNIAIEHDSLFLKYNELCNEARKISAVLISRGLDSGDRVIVCGQNSAKLITTMVGVLLAGGAFVPLDPLLPTDRCRWMQKDCNPKFVFIDSSVDPKVFDEDTGSELIFLEHIDQMIGLVDSDTKLPIINSTDPAYIIYTSGSTGNPKGVEISHSAFANYVFWASSFYKMNEGEGVLLHGSISFDATLTTIFPPLISGQTIKIVDKTDDPIRGLVEAINRERDISLIKLTPAHLDLLNSAFNKKIPKKRVRTLILGGEALKSSALEPWLENNTETKIINEYGPTETVVGCCIHEARKSDLEYPTIPIGRPINNTNLTVIDDCGSLLPIGVAGELAISGAGLATGYINQADLTESKFVSLSESCFSDGKSSRSRKSYLTGDLVRWDKNGVLHYLGRKDDQIQLRGYRIEPEEIENAINAIDGVDFSAVTVFENHPLDIRLVTFLKYAYDVLDSMSFREILLESLPSYMVPSDFRVVETIPMNTAGKIDRKALKEMAKIKHNNCEDQISDYSSSSILEQIWKEILSLNVIPSNTNFFDLGGHSILVIRMSEMINDRINVEIDPIDIYQSPTLSLLSTLVAHKKQILESGFTSKKSQRRGASSREKRNRATIQNIQAS